MNKAHELFDLVHCDIWGPYRVSSLCGAHYFLTIVDDASRGVWVYLMWDKSEADYFLKQFIIMAKTQFGKGVKVAQPDNGAESKSRPMLQLYSEQGIVHQ